MKSFFIPFRDLISSVVNICLLNVQSNVLNCFPGTIHPLVMVTPSPLAAANRPSTDSSPTHSHSHSHSQMSRNSSRKSNNSLNCKLDGTCSVGHLPFMSLSKNTISFPNVAGFRFQILN